MPIVGVHVQPKTLADGTRRFYYVTHRDGGVRFWHTDGYRLDVSAKRLPPEFTAAYEAAVKENRSQAEGTFGALVRDYLASEEFDALRPATQPDRRRYLDRALDMKLRDDKRAKDAPLRVFDSRKILAHIYAWRDTMAATPKAADDAVVALSAVLQWGVKRGRLDWNRARAVERLYEAPTQSVIWQPQHEAAFLSDCSDALRQAWLFARYAGMRREDLVAIPRSARTDNHLIWRTSKSRDQRTIVVPLFPKLRSVLDEIDAAWAKLAADDERPTPTTILFNSRGLPWTPLGLSASFNKQRAKHSIEPSLHKLRKNAATDWVIAQRRNPDLISDADIMDMFGWTPKTLRMMKRIYVNDDAVIEALQGVKR